LCAARTLRPICYFTLFLSRFLENNIIDMPFYVVIDVVFASCWRRITDDPRVSQYPQQAIGEEMMR